jgi:ATP-dependent 26S proteasome regulatory subunit
VSNAAASENQRPSAWTAPLPTWARKLVTCYESGAASQFILFGNVGDRMMLPVGSHSELGDVQDFLFRVLLDSFDVILSYDPGNGVRVEKGDKVFTTWPMMKGAPSLPKAPFNAIEMFNQYLQYCSNLAMLGKERIQVAIVLRSADLIIPGFQGGLSYELNAMALLVRDWSSKSTLTQHPLATFLITENLNDLHPHLVNNARTEQIEIPLPSPAEIEQMLALVAGRYAKALSSDPAQLKQIAQQFSGAQLASIEELLKTRQYAGKALAEDDFADLKKNLVEKDCNGLIEFIESDQTLDDLYGMEKIKTWLKQDIELWRQNDTNALPMGYLLCGPVGCGKTFLVKCLAGQAGVPVVRLKNFRDKWVGSSEGNLEKIFRLLHALGRCYVFIDEADQALGKRDSGSNDSGVSGRLYSMMAEEMSNGRNRGSIIWILASSRPDLIEVDLKRPGRVDVKIPIFPTLTPQEGFGLIRSLCKRRGLEIAETDFEALKTRIPNLLTPGAAEVIAVKVYRLVRVNQQTPLQALLACLQDYQNPVPAEIMQAQIELAVREASDLEFVPPTLRKTPADQANARN